MREARTNPNDRLRTVAYEYFEHRPDPSMIPELLASLDKEDAEFVRPALVRALAALGSDARTSSALVRESGRGEDFFRSAVIEALGDYKAAYAVDALAAIARQDGPLLDDSALALGKIGDSRALETLATLQRTASPALQPIIAASTCLLGVQCAEQEQYLIDILKTSGESGQPQEMVRAGVTGLGALALAGRSSAAEALLELGAHARDPLRAPVALAVATIALRNTPLAFALLEKAPQADAISLLAEGFDMLEEDFDKETVLRARAENILECSGRIANPVADADPHRFSGLLMDYRQSGVDIDAGNETVRRIKQLARATFTPGVLCGDRIVRRPLQTGS